MFVVLLCVTVVLMVLLAYFDPKRAARFRGVSWVSQARKALVVVLLLPAVGLLMQERYLSLTLWIAATAVIGWFVTICFNRRPPADSADGLDHGLSFQDQQADSHRLVTKACR